ncbi:MAG: hypothetical protein RLY50_105 [Actinomycetota bacterium]
MLHLPELSYDYGALEPHLSARIIEVHHSKHHKAYVDGANHALEQLAHARDHRDMSLIVGLEKSLAFHLSGHVLHTIYWENLSPDGGGEPTGELAQAIGENFSAFAAFAAHMTAAVATVQGSGWAVLSWHSPTARLVIEQVENHQNNSVQNSTPLLAIDAWEHAYYLQYENRRADYATAIWNVINWADVARRFGDAQ